MKIIIGILIFLGMSTPVMAQTIIPNVSGLATLDPTVNPDVEVQGYASAFDGGAARFHGVPGSSAAIDGCITFAGLTGRFVANDVPAPFPGARCGVVADGVTNNAAALQRLCNLDMAVILPQSSFVTPIKSNAGITCDMSRVKLDMAGGAIDWSGLTAGPAITWTQSDPSISAVTAAHPFSNGYNIGPSASSGIDFMQFAPTTFFGQPWATGVIIENVGAFGFRSFAYTGPGTVDITIDGTKYAGGIFLDIGGGSNSGEMIRVKNTFIANALACLNDHNSSASNTDVYFDDVSCDGTSYILSGGATPGAGSSQLNVWWRGHIEATTVTDYAINISNGGLTFSGMFDQFASQSHIPCQIYQSYSAEEQGLTFDGVVFSDGRGSFAPWGNYPTTGSYTYCNGNGPIRVKDVSTLGNTTLGFFADGNNEIAHPLAPWPTQWHATGPGTVTQDTGSFPNGTTASLLVRPGGGSEDLEFDVPCHPGDIPAIQIQTKSSGVYSSGGNFSMRVKFEDSFTGTLVNGPWVSIGYDSATFVSLQSLVAQFRAPAGTAFCAMELQANGSGSAWAGYPMMTVHH